MEKKTTYVAKIPDKDGIIAYSDEENAVWKTLYERQLPLIENRACKEYLAGIKKLSLIADRIPQCSEVSESLKSYTDWQVQPVEALISFDEFYTLLANKTFPAASFIRTRDDLDYLQEPDIFHELFGHCPLLTDQAFADFTQAFGEIGLRTPKQDRARLARLYWFTVEFGLIDTPEGYRIYGGGILSSKGESEYALESDIPFRKPFDALEALRTPYRYDQMQMTYFVIKSFNDFYQLIQKDLAALIAKSHELGDYPSRFKGEDPKAIEMIDVHSC